MFIDLQKNSLRLKQIVLTLEKTLMVIFEHQAKCFQFCYPIEVIYSHKEDTIIIFFKD